MITPRSDRAQWLVAKTDRIGPILQLNIGTWVLLRCVGADTGWYSFGPGSFDFEFSPSLTWAKYVILTAIVLLAVGMLGRRKCAWMMEGLFVCALGATVVIGTIWLFDGPIRSVFALILLLAYWLFRVGAAMMRHGTTLEERRLQQLASGRAGAIVT